MLSNILFYWSCIIIKPIKITATTADKVTKWHKEKDFVTWSTTITLCSMIHKNQTKGQYIQIHGYCYQM